MCRILIETYSVPLTTVVKEFNLEVACAATDYENIQLTVPDVARPGLQLAGYYDHFEPMRLQILGNAEISYLNKMTSAQRTAIYDRLFAYKFPALVLSRNGVPTPECLEMARKHNITLLRSQNATGSLISAVTSYLNSALAPRITRHGVLMEVYGEGVLIMGESGIGKSETAIELLKRGHRLIADDGVEIKRISGSCLMGTAIPVLRDYVELRGIGFLNVSKLFGMGAVKQENEINLVVNIVHWDPKEPYDRIGAETQYVDILGVKVPTNTIPVKPGRNLAVILEVAAMNNRQRKMGYNPALEFIEQSNRHFAQLMKEAL